MPNLNMCDNLKLNTLRNVPPLLGISASCVNMHNFLTKPLGFEN